MTFKGENSTSKLLMPKPRRGQSAIGDFATTGPSEFRLTRQPRFSIVTEM